METPKIATRALGALVLGVAVAGCAEHTTTQPVGMNYPTRVTGTAPVATQPAPVVTSPAPSTTTTTIFVPHAPPGPAVSAPGAAAPTSRVTPSAADVDLMRQAAQDSMAEIRLAQMAEQRAGSEMVRQLAQRIVLDHTNANAELLPLARERGVTVSPILPQEHQAAEHRLASLFGTQFDIAFLEHMIGDHAKSVAMLERAAATATDPMLRTWAARQLTVVRHHQATALNLHAQLARTGVYPSASPPLR
jgi:putative membrane protein